MKATHSIHELKERHRRKIFLNRMHAKLRQKELQERSDAMRNHRTYKYSLVE